ncbi:TonB-dependent receptor plug domain-containing protein [Duganella violaceipulchra]|uniref:Outer membrane receptor protein involved in Fe transport n=1 Tax=Duganella violaceipulchra TaxID=2849652 RepID=A0AA41HHR4_9BURK|nr:TonB-dependent receptor [Duganella violaceicalia]MBV6325397.1 TonB-dependent receptor [Duganella violaceicalia]MCP2012598.1 outer membrane receptor protein involved in Fe transport [Duganella violaceicalia]
MQLHHIAGGLLLVAASAHAADSEPQQVKVSGQRADQRQRETTTSITVNHEDIVRQGDQTLADVLKRLPGISITGVPGRGGTISMRGLGNGYTQIMLNGEPVAAGFSLDTIEPEMIERIDIMRSATAEFSNQAVAGSINIILKKAIRRGQRTVSASLARHAGVDTPALSATLSDQDGGYSYSLAATLTRNRSAATFNDLEELSNAGGTLIEQRRTAKEESGRSDALTVTPRLNWTFAGGDTLTWLGFANLRRVDKMHSEDETALVGPHSEYPRSLQHFAANFSMLRSDLNWTHLLEGGAKLETKLGLSDNRRNGTFDFNGMDADGKPAGRHHVDSGPSETSVTASGTYRHPVGERHAIALGWDASHAVRNEDRSETLFDASGAQTGSNNADYRAIVNRLALFAQDEWQVTERYSLYLGLRHESLSTSSRANAANAPDALDLRSQVWSPSLQSRYQLPNKDVLRLALSRTYKAPPLAQLVPRRYTNDNNNNQTNPDEQGNPNLRPELAWGLDAAYEHYLGAGALLSASTYMRRIRDVTLTRLFQQDGEWVEAPFNSGNASVRGIELEAKLPLSPRLDLRANLTRNWSRLDSVPGPNNRLENQVPFTANLGADYRLPDAAWTFGGNLNYQAGGPVRQSALVQMNTSPKRELDLYGLWKMDAKTQLRFSASNLLRQQSSESHEYVNEDGRRYRISQTPTSATLRILLEHQL